MGLLNLNDVLIDTSKISYIGLPDRHVKHHVGAGVVTHFFLVVVDGHAIEIQSRTDTDLKKLRDKLVEELTMRKGDLPA